MRSETVAWLANVRAQADGPGALLVVIRRMSGGSVAIFPEDIVGKSDDELLAFIAARLQEHA
ncbi:hypothetical protein [Massilia sp. TN1-12]|uniref:hypothetical protein n=1 Tax=Massilia paldalensis TaxID=3377675 RepID=UPI00384A46F1